MGFWRKEKSHLLRKSPPSTGKRDLLAEIQYSLTVIVTGRSVVKKVRDFVHHATRRRLKKHEIMSENIADQLQKDPKPHILFIFRSNPSTRTFQAELSDES